MFTLLTIILLPMGTLMLLFFAPVILTIFFKIIGFMFATVVYIISPSFRSKVANDFAAKQYAEDTAKNMDK